MKYRLLFLIGSYDVGGKERQMTEIIKNLSKDKYEIYLFAKIINSNYFKEIKETLSSSMILNKKSFSIMDFLILNKYMNNIKPTHVISFSKTTAHFALLCKVLFFKKYKLINASIRSAPLEFDFLEKIERFLYNFYPVVVSNSFAGLKAYGQENKRGRYVLYNGIKINTNAEKNIQEIQNEYKLDNKFVVLMISSLRKCISKDPMTFIKTAEYLYKTHEDIMFLLVGDGTRRKELEDYAKKNNITNLVFLGNCDNINRLLLASDVSVLTSRSEGISNAILESMAYGLPVIATSIGGTNEIIENQFDGLIEKFGDTKGIANRIIELKNNKSLYQKISNNAKIKSEKKFNIDLMIKRFKKICEIS